MLEKPSNPHKIFKEAHAVDEETRTAYENGLLENLEKRVFKPLFDVDYKTNTQDIAQGNNRMRFTKTELGTQDKKLLADYIARPNSRGVVGDGNIPDDSHWLAVDQLIYKIGETNIDVFSYLPEGYKILFCPTSKSYNGAVDDENKVIYITSDISSLGSIATILHEVGHVKDYERLEKLGRTEFTEGGDYHENIAAEQMRKEREASLFALRKMWRELRKNEQTKKDILLYLKNLAYFSHYLKGFENISTARVIQNHNPYDLDLEMKQEIEREQLNAWERFRKSNEYQAWKNIEEFKKLKEYEEYGAWSKWIEEAGKNNDSQFLAKYFGYEE